VYAFGFKASDIAPQDLRCILRKNDLETFVLGLLKSLANGNVDMQITPCPHKKIFLKS